MPEPDRSPDANVGGWLRTLAARQPDAPAIIEAATGARTSYSELNALSNRVAQALLDAGLKSGDRVALALPSEPLYLAIYFGASKIGAILLPLNPRLTEPELALLIDDAEPRVAIQSGDLVLPRRPDLREFSAREFRTALPLDAPEPAEATGGEEPHVLMYTSGTTGEPKGAVLPHRKTVFNTLNSEIYFGLTRADVVIVPVPLFHSFGLKILSVPALFAGATVVLFDRLNAGEIQDRVAEHGGTILGGIPLMYRRMARLGLNTSKLASLRFAFSAGAALDVETIGIFHAAGVPLRQGYGQTETSILCCLDADHALERAGSVGRPVHHCELRIADASGQQVAPGTPGEILVRGPVRMLGYWRRPDDTAQAGRGGWHHTGDLGVMDERGFVTLVGRLKEMYISGGENVYPAEVERVLGAHPNVAEVAVIGVPDPEWGEVGRAYVVPSAKPFDPDELLEWSRARLAPHKRPRQISVVDQLPRTASGKVQTHRLP